MQNCYGTGFGTASERFSKPDTIKPVQVACKNSLTELNEGSNLCVIHTKRVKLQPKDLHLAVELRRDEEKMLANVNWTN